MATIDRFDAFLQMLFKTLLKEGKVADEGTRTSAAVCMQADVEYDETDSDRGEPVK